MISWSTILPAIVTWVTAIAADTTRTTTSFTAEWKDRPVKAVHPGQRVSVLMTITSVVGYGTDEVRYEYVDPGSTDPDDAAFLGQQREYVIGQRKFTLRIRVIGTENTDGLWAMSVTERIRTSLNRQSQIDALLAVNVSVIDVLPARDVRLSDRGHQLSAAEMDIVLGTCVSDADPAPVGWIETIFLDSEIHDEDGTLAPSPPNVTGHQIPPA